MELTIYFDSNSLILTDCKNTNNSVPTSNQKDFSDIDSILTMFAEHTNTVYTLFHTNFQGLLDEVKKHFLYIEAAGGVVENEIGEILCIMRRGMWDLPKGKLDKHETPPEAAIREVMEETGLSQVQLKEYICSTWHTYNHEKGKGPVLKQTYWYKMNAPKSDSLCPEAQEQITAAEWVAKTGLAQIKESTYPSIIDVLHAL